MFSESFDFSSSANTTIEPGCDGYVYEDHCYYVSSEESSWRGATQQCVRSGGGLASIHNAQVDALIGTILQTRNKESAWIGARNEGHDWIWVNCKLFQ